MLSTVLRKNCQLAYLRTRTLGIDYAVPHVYF